MRVQRFGLRLLALAGICAAIGLFAAIARPTRTPRPRALISNVTPDHLMVKLGGPLGPQYKEALRLWKAGDLKSAEKKLFEARAQFRAHGYDEFGQMWSDLVDIYAEMGEPAKALEACRKIAGIHPRWSTSDATNPTFLKKYAMLEEKAGHRDAAAKLYRQVLSMAEGSGPTSSVPLNLNPHGFTSLKATALVCFTPCTTDEGVAVLLKATDLDPNNGELHLRAADALMNTHRLSLAKKQIKLAMRGRPDRDMRAIATRHLNYISGFSIADLNRLENHRSVPKANLDYRLVPVIPIK